MTEPAAPIAKIISGLGADPQADTAHRLPVINLDQHTYDRALSCVHCGLCLPACPTYTENGLEADSPRGRIYLMKGLADGAIEATDSVVEHLDLCLDCQACETACPSGVVYHELIEATRAQLSKSRKLSIVDRFVQLMFLRVFPHPTRLKLSLIPVRLLQKIGLWKLLTHPSLTKLLPAQLEKMQQMLPPTGPVWEKPLGERYRAFGETKKTVAFFPGCIGSVMFQTVNRKSIALLQKAGCDVLVSPEQGCCGAIHLHAGFEEGARDLMKHNVDLFVPLPDGKPTVDYVINNISGCGAALKDAGHLLRSDPTYAERAKTLGSISRDVSEVLAEVGLPTPKHPVERTVTYHHACHLAHAQRVTTQPLELLRQVEGLTIEPLHEADMCCGAAGTYNLTQPEMARNLAERKLQHIQESGASTCVTGNVGCAMQIQSEGDRMGVNLSVARPVEILYESQFGPDGDEH